MTPLALTTLINKASHLVEALPYVRRFYGKTVVIKCGGAAMTADENIDSIMQDIALLYFCGVQLVIVHGGGPEISQWCARLQLPVQFIKGQRYTDAATLEIVQMVLLGKVNQTLVTKLNQLGAKAVGISGHDAGFLRTEKTEDEDDLGYVGKITHVDLALVNTLLSSRFITVAAPIGVDADGQAHNINGDTAAAAIASKLTAEKLIILSDVNGLYGDLNDPSTQISCLTVSDAKGMIRDDKIVGGMLPKLQACVDAVENGVSAAHIVSGKLVHGLLLEILTDRGVGTMVTS